MAEGGKGPERSEAFYIQQLQQRYALAKWALSIPCIAALWIPFQAALPIAEAFAGKDTTVSGSLSISIVISLGSLGGWVTTVLRGRNRSAELQELRGRTTLLEEQLERATVETA